MLVSLQPHGMRAYWKCDVVSDNDGRAPEGRVRQRRSNAPRSGPHVPSKPHRPAGSATDKKVVANGKWQLQTNRGEM